MVGASDLRSELAGELPAMLSEIERFASIDSGSYDVAGIDAVADGFGELFAARGFEVTRTGHELTARRELGPGPTLLLLGHADTVWAEGWPVTRDGDWLRGPGVGDMKGCVVMAAHALGVALAHGPERPGAVEVLIVPDEELGSPASRAWIEERARAADACLGLEAGWPGGGVVVARGAVGAFYVTARGRTAHVAAHEDGRARRQAPGAPGARRGARGGRRQRRLGPRAARRGDRGLLARRGAGERRRVPRRDGATGGARRGRAPRLPARARGRGPRGPARPGPRGGRRGGRRRGRAAGARRLHATAARGRP